jgi:Mce-associated membrane protein
MPPRPRSPRPRPTPSRRPRVAGMAPTAARLSGRAEDRPGDPADVTAAAPASDAPAADRTEANGRAPVEEQPDTSSSSTQTTPRPEPAPPANGDAAEDHDEPALAPTEPALGQPGPGDIAALTEPAPTGPAPAGDAPAADGEQPEPQARKPRRKQRPASPRLRPSTAHGDSPGKADDERPAEPPTEAIRIGGDGAEEPSAKEARARGGRLPAVVRRRAVPLLAAALVVLAAVAVVAGIQDARLRGTPAAANTALVDVGTTAEVAGQLSDAIETVYSFDFARLDENENAAREVITPAFAAEFDRLFAEVRARAPEQQAVVSATVTLSAVKEITGDRAVLVAFVDQQATRAAPEAEQQQLAAAGRLTVTGERVDGRWKIAAVTPL